MQALLLGLGCVLVVVGLVFAYLGVGIDGARGSTSFLGLEGPAWLLLVAFGVGIVLYGSAERTPDPGPPDADEAVPDLSGIDDLYRSTLAAAVDALEGEGLEVRTDGSGCSNSVSEGRVRQVTAGRELNERILFGKSTDKLDAAAVDALRTGAEVTVWISEGMPCP